MTGTTTAVLFISLLFEWDLVKVTNMTDFVSFIMTAKMDTALLTIISTQAAVLAETRPHCFVSA
jgi:hypothetical protein